MPPRLPKPQLTHFLCVPLITPSCRTQMQASLAAFRAEVTTDPASGASSLIPERAIRPLGTLHLTLGVMSLATDDRVNEALALLKSINLTDLISTTTGSDGSQVSRLGSLTVTLRGLESMHPPAKTSILYCSPVDHDSRLRDFCLNLRAIFAEFLVPDTRPLLLHATIVNTIYVPGTRGKGSGHGKSRAKLTIDARDLLEKYQDFEWMKDVRVEKVAICRMGAKKMDDGNEEYVVESEIEMPRATNLETEPGLHM
ncbi:hypothetical protein PVAG01_06578 [Phlyctema vagabunda]|uniref:A-kinase anchor protein 7-like phosphoesterase domain-containing protein n=1 Tax=Phlyctema vagabunda TaxID=108571 RepID=A0ABR4PH43_9HELO